MPKKALGMTLLPFGKYIFALVFLIFCCFSSLPIMSIYSQVFFKEFVFVFTIPFTFYYLNIFQELVFKISFHKLTRNSKALTSLDSARFKLSGSSFLVAFLSWYCLVFSFNKVRVEIGVWDYIFNIWDIRKNNFHNFFIYYISNQAVLELWKFLLLI